MGRTIVLGFAIALITPCIGWAAPGDHDPTFGNGGYVYANVGSQATTLVLQPDAKLVAGGSGLARFNSDGTPDTSFGGTGVVGTPIGVGALALQSDGKIVIAGGASGDIALERYNPDGTPDTTFGVSGGTTGPTLPGNQSANGLVIQGDGKIVVAASSGGSDFIIVRYNANGSIDSGFGSGGVATVVVGSNATATGLALQPDGMLVVAGSILTTDSFAVLVRVDGNGVLDPLFGSGGIAVGPAHTNATDVLVEPNGKLVAAAGFGDVFGMPPDPDSLAAIRWNADGSLDSGFGTGGVASVAPGGVAAIANAIVREPDGGFVVAGDSVMTVHETDIVLARFDADGNLDSSFGTGGVVSDVGPLSASSFPHANALIRQPDGKAVVAGEGLTLTGMPPSGAPASLLVRYLGVFACGNGILEPGESCDDGNTLANDCCTPACEIPSCRAAGKSLVVITGDGTGPKDKLIWKWLRGDATSVAELSDPTSATNYTLCLYAGTAPIRTVAIPATPAKWTPIGMSGFRYSDSTASADGVFKVLLKSGGAGKAKALVRGKGPALPDGILPVPSLPLVVQLVNSDTNACFATTFDAADVTKNTASQFKAKAP